MPNVVAPAARDGGEGVEARVGVQVAAVAGLATRSGRIGRAAAGRCNIRLTGYRCHVNRRSRLDNSNRGYRNHVN